MLLLLTPLRSVWLPNNANQQDLITTPHFTRRLGVHYQVDRVVVVADITLAVRMNETDSWSTIDMSPFDNCWYKALMITLYSVVCVGCIVGNYMQIVFFSIFRRRMSRDRITFIDVKRRGRWKLSQELNLENDVSFRNIRACTCVGKKHYFPNFWAYLQKWLVVKENSNKIEPRIILCYFIRIGIGR